MNFQTNLKNILIIKELIRLRKCRLKCWGDSMMPLYHPGEKIVISPVEGEINLGDVVLYFSDEKGGYFLVLHRVHYINEDFVVLKGDNNYSFDIPILKNSILGKTESKNCKQIDTVRAKNFFTDYKRERLDEKKK